MLVRSACILEVFDSVGIGMQGNMHGNFTRTCHMHVKYVHRYETVTQLLLAR